jgi:hypothetical protein
LQPPTILTDVVDETGSNNGVYTVTLSNQSSSATTVSYSVSGTATSGTDFTALSGTVTIPANTSSAAINLTILTDLLVEADETVIVTLTGITAGDDAIAVDTSNDEATITIPDNDNALVSIAATDDEVTKQEQITVFTLLPCRTRVLRLPLFPTQFREQQPAEPTLPL